MNLTLCCLQPLQCYCLCVQLLGQTGNIPCFELTVNWGCCSKLFEVVENDLLGRAAIVAQHIHRPLQGKTPYRPCIPLVQLQLLLTFQRAHITYPMQPGVDMQKSPMQPGMWP